MTRIVKNVEKTAHHQFVHNGKCVLWDLILNKNYNFSKVPEIACGLILD